MTKEKINEDLNSWAAKRQDSGLRGLDKLKRFVHRSASDPNSKFHGAAKKILDRSAAAGGSLKVYNENEQVVDSTTTDTQPNLVDAVKAAISGEPATFQSTLNAALTAKAQDAVGQYRDYVSQTMFSDQPPSEDYEEGPEDEDEVDEVDDGEVEPEDFDDEDIGGEEEIEFDDGAFEDEDAEEEPEDN